MVLTNRQAIIIKSHDLSPVPEPSEDYQSVEGNCWLPADSNGAIVTHYFIGYAAARNPCKPVTLINPCRLKCLEI